jgi:hypothetical protein
MFEEIGRWLEVPPEATSTAEGLLQRGLSAEILCSNQQNADRQCASTATVRKHVRPILSKLGATNRTRAVAVARSPGLPRRERTNRHARSLFELGPAGITRPGEYWPWRRGRKSLARTSI